MILRKIPRSDNADYEMYYKKYFIFRVFVGFFSDFFFYLDFFQKRLAKFTRMVYNYFVRRGAEEYRSCKMC